MHGGAASKNDDWRRARVAPTNPKVVVVKRRSVRACEDRHRSQTLPRPCGSHAQGRGAAADAVYSVAVGGRPSYGVDSTMVVRVVTLAAERISCSRRSSPAGLGTRTS